MERAKKVIGCLSHRPAHAFSHPAKVSAYICDVSDLYKTSRGGGR